jgi:salicylate hydroxylase
MREPTPLVRQVAALRHDRLRVLVVGAGMAGVTLARLLRGQGLHPVLVERARAGHGAGYMLGMLPFVDPVVRRLDAEPAYLDRSVAMRRYALRGRHGQPLRTYRLDEAVAPFGHYRGIERGTLLELLAGDGLPVTFDTVVDRIDGRGPLTVTLLESGTRHEVTVDAVVGADGLNSGVRDRLLRPAEVTRVDTGWGGWVAWSPADDAPDLYEEVWGDGYFLGLYPVEGRTGVFLGAPASAAAHGPRDLADHARARMRRPGPRLTAALDAVGTAPGAYRWDFADARSARWTRGPVALVGDAAAAFLPTAGVGAAMAIESAAVLADSLAGVTPGSVDAALEAYERVQRPRVEAAQRASRSLARLMFRTGAPVTAARDAATRLVSLRTAFGPILRLLADRPGRLHPDTADPRPTRRTP